MNSFYNFTPGMTKPLRVAAYCRVSTKREEQDGSYEMQIDYFTDLIQKNPNMELVGIYGDKGKSGLKTAGRPGLKSLMDDCRAGKVDLILSKSISRFARNMADCVDLIRELQSLGVYAYFEKEGVNTKDEKCALMLNIFSAIAQEESNSISQNLIRSHEQAVLEGRPFGTISYGYYNGGGNRWAIDEEEAPLVRKAFEMAGEGRCYRDIQKELTRMDPMGTKWTQVRLRYLLTNPVYKGDYYSHRTVNVVPGKQVVNKGIRDRFYIKDHHAPIVSRALFDAVQQIVERGIIQTFHRWSEEDENFLKGVMQNEGNEN